MSEYRTTVGIEVHAELKTKTKMFSNSANHYGASSNTNMNLIDFGYPGTLPQVNRYGVELGIRAGLVLNCQINHHMHFDRKNYFYPDLPKGYQITQTRTPIGVHGYVEIEDAGEIKRIGIHDIHLEEDTCKSVHTKESALLDFNRAGVPLLEIVSDPDIHSPQEAMLYLEKLRELLLYSDVSDVKIEEGSMRCDVNVSVSKTDQLGVRAEIKNVSSIAAVGMAIASETKRQIALLESGGVQEEETRRYDEAKDETILMRKKETGNDYRYFPEPDIPRFEIDDAWIERVRQSLPEMPAKRRERYINELELPEYDAMVLTQTKEMSDFFDATIENGADAKLASNWLMGEVSAYLNSEKLELNQSKLTPESLASMIQLIVDGTISSKIAKKVFQELMKNGGDPKVIVKEKGLIQLSDPAQLLPIINEVLDNNAQSIEDFKNGKDRAVGFLVGQIMKATKGQANPGVVNQLLKQELGKR